MTPAARAAFLAALIPALSPILATGCSRGAGAGPEAAPAVKPREAARVRTAPIERREMVRTISTTTTVESEREIRVFPRASGVVIRVAVEEGDRVAAGAVLCELDRRASQAAIQAARIALREAEDETRKAQFALPEAENRAATARLRCEQATREFERNEKAGLISAQALDNLRVARDTALSEEEGARLAVERARADIEARATQKAKQELALQQKELEDSYLVVTAPFAGVIAQRLVKVGDSTGPAMHAFVLTDPSALRAIVHRPQRELPLFVAAHQRSDGQQLEIRTTSEALPGRTFSGEIQLVSPSIDPQSGSFRVTVRLPPAAPGEAGLLPGMLVRLEIVTERHRDALAVPKRALRREGGADFVFLVDGGRARRTEVREGFSDDEYTEIEALTGAELAAGQRIVVVGNRELEDGAEVIAEDSVPAPGTDAPAASEAAASGSKG